MEGWLWGSTGLSLWESSVLCAPRSPASGMPPYVQCRLTNSNRSSPLPCLARPTAHVTLPHNPRFCLVTLVRYQSVCVDDNNPTYAVTTPNVPCHLFFKPFVEAYIVSMRLLFVDVLFCNSETKKTRLCVIWSSFLASWYEASFIYQMVLPLLQGKGGGTMVGWLRFPLPF